MGYSFRCEHKIFSANLKRDPSCHEAAPRLYYGAPSRQAVFFIMFKIVPNETNEKLDCYSNSKPWIQSTGVSVVWA